jgi:Sap, sulfolipid-1-addressing protein
MPACDTGARVASSARPSAPAIGSHGNFGCSAKDQPESHSLWARCSASLASAIWGPLDHIVALNPGAVIAVLLVVFFCVMQQLLLELPLLGYVFAPEWTPGVVSRSRAWLHRRGRRIAIVVLVVLGLVLVVRGVATFAG